MCRKSLNFHKILNLISFVQKGLILSSFRSMVSGHV